jgi:TonB family protein
LPLEAAPFGLASALHLSAWGISLTQEEPVPLATIRQWLVGVILAFWMATAGAVLCPSQAIAQEQAKIEELSRKAKTKVAPVYPEIARRMNIGGTVRLAVIVAPNGTLKSSKAVGGHPLLVNAAMEAMKQWKFEPAQTESSGIVEFKFKPQN